MLDAQTEIAAQLLSGYVVNARDRSPEEQEEDIDLAWELAGALLCKYRMETIPSTPPYGSSTIAVLRPTTKERVVDRNELPHSAMARVSGNSSPLPPHESKATG